MRIQKYLSQCGLCSRREAEKKILEGKVLVNGKPAEIGCSVEPENDRVVYEGKLVKGLVEDKVVLAMNKPTGYLCTNEDQFGGQTVFELLHSPHSEMKMFCVGRLDKNSEGLLILTNDGDLANRIIHPSSGIIKRYRVLLNRDFDETLVQRLLDGVVHDGEKLRAAKVILPSARNKMEKRERRLEIWLNQGRKREIRRMLEAVGFFVKELVRIQIGSFELKRMPIGSYRVLAQKEIDKLLSNPQ